MPLTQLGRKGEDCKEFIEKNVLVKHLRNMVELVKHSRKVKNSIKD